MASEIAVRRAEPAHASHVAEVLYAAFAEFEALYTPAAFAATAPRAEDVLVRMSEGPVWIAVHEGEVVGTVAAVVREESLYVRGMGVRPSARSLKVGTRLIEAVERYAVEKGQSRIFLSTTPFLHAAIRLYEKHGFRKTEAGPHGLFGTALFTMEKRILPK